MTACTGDNHVPAAISQLIPAVSQLIIGAA